MYAGHFAAGLALKARVPTAPTWALLLGVGLLDVLFGPFLLLGIERATLTPSVPPGFSLDYIDWSHSLLTSLAWATLYAGLFWPKGRAIATVMWVAVFSHFLLDLPMHPPDLALWPHSNVHLGFGLWRSLPVGWWFVELTVIAACLGYYWSRARGSTTFGGRPAAIAIVVLLLHAMNSPWLAVGK